MQGLRLCACAIALTAFAAVDSGVSAAVEQVTFCQRYTQALNGGSASAITSANEVALISAVVDRALSGNTTTTAGGNAVRGILNSPLQRQFFTSPTNFYANTMARDTLVAHLKSFFTVAFGCKEVTSPGTFSANMRAVHANMNINNTVWNDFLGELVSTLQSFGVSSADVTYAAALLYQFQMSATGDNQICSAADCPAAVAYSAFIAATNADGAYVWVDAAQSDLSDNTVDIALNGNVHWDMAATHSVVETDSSFAVKDGGFTSGAVGATQSYTRAFTTAGVYYFKCGNPNHTVMRGVIRVAQTQPNGAFGRDSAFSALLHVAVTASVVLLTRASV